jgi:3D (Asp-Asp-Asp) domain-containing protein
MHPMSGKCLAFVLPVILFWTNAVQAETLEKGVSSESEIMSSFIATDRLKLDEIFSIGSVISNFEPVRSSVSTLETEKSPEEIILDRWKVKQFDRWNGLPEGKFEINASAYTASSDECGNSRGITASGLKVVANRTLACPPSFPFGANVSIEGFGTFRCEDRGGAIKGNHFDIYMKTKKEAFAFGRRNLIAEVVID